MNNNDILRRLRYALDLGNAQMVRLFKLGHLDINQAELMALLARDEDASFVECADRVLGQFLDGLILDRRGPHDSKIDAPGKNVPKMTNNDILKKMRIALELKEDDMLAILKLGGRELSRAEFRALFRNEGHKNYKSCGDQMLRNFLQGLTCKLRKIEVASA